MKVLRGFAILAFVFFVTAALTDDLTAAILATCLALVVMPPSLDPAIQMKELFDDHRPS